MAATTKKLVVLLLTALYYIHLLPPSSSFNHPTSLPPVRTAALSMSVSTSAPTLSIGPTSLRTLLQTTSRELQQQDDSGLDVPGIVWLEHINLVVGDMNMAKKFYVEFLGCTVDENVKHFNLGQQQFHVAANNDPPQRISGSICLTVPSLDNIRSRAQAAQTSLKNTLFTIHEGENPKMMTVTCPWGNTFHLYDISIDKDVDTSDPLEASPQKMVNLHREGSIYGSHRMAVRGQPGIRAVEISCAKGTSAKIAQFYKTFLGCAVVPHSSSDTTTNSIYDAVAVSVGPGVQLLFVENEDLTNEHCERMKGVHICIYIPNFKSTYETLQRQGLIWTNPRFTHLDSCDTWEEAYESRTFRFKDIVDVDKTTGSGRILLELEHETRPMMHGQYLKVPRYIPK